MFLLPARQSSILQERLRAWVNSRWGLPELPGCSAKKCLCNSREYFDEAAAILDMEVWAALSKCGVNPGESVLVLGPGAAGMVACQVARILGAGRVILAGPDSDRM